MSPRFCTFLQAGCHSARSNHERGKKLGRGQNIGRTRLQKVQKRGLIERIPNPDRCPQYAREADGCGRELVEKVVFEHVENERRILEKLPAETYRQLDAGLAELMRVLEDAKKD